MDAGLIESSSKKKFKKYFRKHQIYVENFLIYNFFYLRCRTSQRLEAESELHLRGKIISLEMLSGEKNIYKQRVFWGKESMNLSSIHSTMWKNYIYPVRDEHNKYSDYLGIRGKFLTKTRQNKNIKYVKSKNGCTLVKQAYNYEMSKSNNRTTIHNTIDKQTKRQTDKLAQEHRQAGEQANRRTGEQASFRTSERRAGNKASRQ